MPTRSPNNGQM